MNKTLTPQVLRPVASPTDIFERPSAGRDLAQLAGALQDFAPSLARFAEVEEAQKSEKEKIAGENKAREIQQQGLTYAEAIKQGLIEPHQSPWFRLGAYETFGRVSGSHYADEFDVAFKQSDAAQSTDPKDFDAFEQKFRADWTEKNLGDKQDPYFQNAFGHTADNRIAGLRANFSQEAGAHLVKQNGEAFHAEVFQTISNAYNVVRTMGGKLDGAFIASQIKLAQDRQKAAGVDYKVTNPLVASAITQAAKRFGDVSILDAMDSVKIGSGSLAGTSYGSNLREAAENEIASINQNRYVAEHQLQERQKEALVNETTGQLSAALLKDPTTDIKPFIATIAKVDASKVDTFIGMQRAFLAREYEEDPVVKRSLFLGIHTVTPGKDGYTTQTKLDRALASQSISPATYSELSSQIKTRDKEGDKTSKLFNDDGYKALDKRVRGLFVAEYGSSTIEQRQRAENAAAEAADKYFRWRQGAGDNADASTVNKWINDEVNTQFYGGNGTKAKGDPADVHSAQGNVPQAQFGGPKAVDPKKVPATSPSTVFQLRSEWLDIKTGKSGKGFSKPMQELLKHFGVPPNAAAIEEFVNTQAKLASTSTPLPE